MFAGGGSGMASKLSTLSIALGARLDLANNKLIVTAGNAGTASAAGVSQCIGSPTPMLTAIPEKPKLAPMSWNEFSYSDTLVNIFCTSSP